MPLYREIIIQLCSFGRGADKTGDNAFWQIYYPRMYFCSELVRSRIRKEADHITFPNTDLIFIENGTFRGQVWKREELREVKKVADEKKLKIHIDGARIFNALAY